jgi:4-aminobutyrate aminotransferase
MQTPHIRTALPGPKAQALLARDEQVVSPSYPRDYPFVMDHGKGVEAWDVDGNRFLDFTAGIAVTSTGHAHPQVVAAVAAAAGRFIHCSSDFWHEGQVRLAETIDRLAPMGEPAMSFFTNSGTEAVEGAIKLARYVTGRSRFIGFTGGFHGRTMGSLAFTASKPTQQAGFFPVMPGVTHVPFPNPYRPLFAGADQGLAVLRYIEEVLFRSNLPPQEVAGILVEPMQGEGGYLTPPDSFLPGLRALCDRHGILLIADEVQTGIGRTGRMFAVEHWGVAPDIMTLAKGLASGMPIGLVVAKRRLMAQWKRGAHGNTYGGNPLCCAAALATLELVENDYLANVNRVGPYLLGAMRALMDKYPVIGEVRGRGLWIGVEFVEDRQDKRAAHDFAERLLHTAFHNGLLLLSCGSSTIRLMPPLMVGMDAAREAVAILDASIAETLAG